MTAVFYKLLRVMLKVVNKQGSVKEVLKERGSVLIVNKIKIKCFNFITFNCVGFGSANIFFILFHVTFLDPRAS